MSSPYHQRWLCLISSPGETLTKRSTTTHQKHSCAAWLRGSLLKIGSFFSSSCSRKTVLSQTFAVHLWSALLQTQMSFFRLDYYTMEDLYRMDHKAILAPETRARKFLSKLDQQIAHSRELALRLLLHMYYRGLRAKPDHRSVPAQDQGQDQEQTEHQRRATILQASSRSAQKEVPQRGSCVCATQATTGLATSQGVQEAYWSLAPTKTLQFACDIMGRRPHDVPARPPKSSPLTAVASVLARL